MRYSSQEERRDGQIVYRLLLNILAWSIARASAKISSADYSELLKMDSLSARGSDEVAQVLRAFRTAARRLDRQQVQLDQDVRARTRESARTTIS